ncbi:unnamed protein product [Timema podura]|uniref:Receptor ligand binding region domain-containing protein n=1 Tax=Timema podura TaxID=61482 RepID=A0ABN7NX61_TIMPD|nr:unnamed protein product [Timema podura]
MDKGHTDLIYIRSNDDSFGVDFQLKERGIFKDKTEYATLTRMSYCQCRLKLVFSSIFNQFGWRHVALLLDRSDLFSLTTWIMKGTSKNRHVNT